MHVASITGRCFWQRSLSPAAGMDDSCDEDPNAEPVAGKQMKGGAATFLYGLLLYWWWKAPRTFAVAALLLWCLLRRGPPVQV